MNSTPGTINLMGVVLVVEDEAGIAEVLEAYLRRDGFQTERASDGKTALSLFSAVRPDLVLLDVQLPGVNGLEILRQIRQEGNTPVIMVTARSEDLDKLLGLELGADDYITKPFSVREVVARVKAVLRRAPAAERATHFFRVGNLEIDLKRMTVQINGQRLILTPTEFRIIQAMAYSPDKVFSRTELMEIALPDSEALERVVDVHLKNLRKKLEDAGAKGLIETVRGMGYRLGISA